MRRPYLSLQLDRRLKNETDRFNVKVIVYHNPDGRQLRRRCNTQCYLNEEEFRNLHSSKQNSEYLIDTRIKIEKYYAEINSIVERLGTDFTLEKFDTLFQSRGLSVSRGRPSKKLNQSKRTNFENCKLTDFFLFFKEYIDELNMMKRFGTAISYKSAMNAFYCFKPDLMFSEITPMFLYSFEEKMTMKGISITTIGIYARSLRSIINLAIAEGKFSAEKYPFGTKRKRKYQIPATRNVKKAIGINQLRQIRDFELTNRNAIFARDMWLFSFYCNGMNIADIFLLKYENIHGDYLRFYRQKTLNTQTERTPIELYLSDPAKEIIRMWGKSDTTPSNYIFTDIEDIKSPKRLYELKGNFTRNINNHMKNLANQLGFDFKLTTYVARHSFATTLKNLGVPTEQISECLGHSDVKTTKSYLDTFSNDVKMKTTELLISAI